MQIPAVSFVGIFVGIEKLSDRANFAIPDEENEQMARKNGGVGTNPNQI
jgi:hypothetical protein